MSPDESAEVVDRPYRDVFQILTLGFVFGLWLMEMGASKRAGTYMIMVFMLFAAAMLFVTELAIAIHRVNEVVNRVR